MPVLSLHATEQTSAEISDDAPVVLVEIDHADLDAPIRLCSAMVERFSVDPREIYGITHDGEEYHYAPSMSGRLPDQMQDGDLRTGIQFDNPDSAVVEALEAIHTPLTVRLFLVLASTPDVIEDDYPGLLGIVARVDAGTVSIDLIDPLSSDEPAHADIMSPARTPCLHVSR